MMKKNDNFSGKIQNMIVYFNYYAQKQYNI